MFSAQILGVLDGCRPIIGLDACFLKGAFDGQLMQAVGRAANNQMFPVAMAVVEAECKDSWEWFLENLIQQIRRREEKGFWLKLSTKLCQDENIGFVQGIYMPTSN